MTFRIRPYALTDVDDLFAAARESVAEVYPWLPWCHPGLCREEAQAWVEEQVKAFAGGEAFEFVILGADGGFVGGCGINLLDRVHQRANLGYWVRTSEAGRGAASAAARAAAAWAFRETDLVRLEILAAVENRPSQRVAEKVGALREGTLRRRLLLHGRHHDAAVYSLLRPAVCG